MGSPPENDRLSYISFFSTNISIPQNQSSSKIILQWTIQPSFLNSCKARNCHYGSNRKNACRLIVNNIIKSQPMKIQQQIENQTASRTLKGAKNGFQLTLSYLEGQSYAYVLIGALNVGTLECFQLRMGQEFIETHQVLYYFFDSPKELMQHLTKTFPELRISEAGELAFDVVVGDVVRKRKIIRIQLDRKEIDRQALLTRELNIIKGQLRELRKAKDSEIEQLRKENADLRGKMEVVFDKFMRETQKKQLLTNNDANLPDLKGLIDKIKRRERLELLTSHPDSREKIGFNEYILEKGVKVVHNRPRWQNYISRFPIKGKLTFRIRQLNLADKCFNLGLGTRAAFGKCEYRQEWIVILDFKAKKLTEDGTSYKIDFDYDENKTIFLKYSQEDNSVSWTIGREQIVETVIPTRMRQQELFLIFQVFDQNDEFLLSVD